MSDETLVQPPKNLGRYEIVRELGRGAMGVVYEAFDPSIKRRVAIKTARREVFAKAGQAEEMMTRFIREAQAAGALNHPNIITIYDTGDHEGVSFIVMEFIEGGSLHDQLSAGCRWDPTDVAELGATLAEALAAAHERGIVHRDIKPANIMLPTRGPAKIADFGIAHTSDSTLTRQGDMIGTPYYMSPEQFMGQKVDARSDLFSLAIILYEMLTGERPFRGQALNTVMHECLKAIPMPPQELNYAVPPALGAVILKALEKSPLHRYQNGTALAEALRESVKESPSPAVTKTNENDATVIGAAPTPIQATNLESTDRGAPIEEAPESDDSRMIESSEPSRFTWTRAYSLAAGVIALLLIVSAATLYAKSDGNASTTTDGAADHGSYFAKINLHAFGITDPACYERFDANDVRKTRDCFDETVIPTAIVCNAEDPSDCLSPRNFTDTAVFDLEMEGKHWKDVRVRLEHGGYQPCEGGPKEPASAPGDVALVELVLISNDIDQTALE